MLGQIELLYVNSVMLVRYTERHFKRLLLAQTLLWYNAGFFSELDVLDDYSNNELFEILCFGNNLHALCVCV